MVLIDSGASHNFLAATLVEELGIPITPTKEFGVVLGTGTEIRAMGVCRQVKLCFANLEIMADFFPIPLGSSEVILGYQWLATLGESYINWGAMTMRFNLGNTRVQLQGDPSLCKTQVSLRSMVQTIQQEGQGILLDFGQYTLTTEDRDHMVGDCQQSTNSSGRFAREIVRYICNSKRDTSSPRA